MILKYLDLVLTYCISTIGARQYVVKSKEPSAPVASMVTNYLSVDKLEMTIANAILTLIRIEFNYLTKI